jgi:hypothetical protein
MWVGRRAHGSGTCWVHGHGDVVLLGKLHFVAVMWSPPRWCLLPCVGCGEDKPRETLALDFFRAAASMDVAPFLKSSLQLLPAPIHALGENQRSFDRAVAALLCRALLKTSSWSPRWVALQWWYGRVTVLLALVLCSASLGKDFFWLFCTLGVSCWAPVRSALVCEQHWPIPGGGRLLVAVPTTMECPDGCGVRWITSFGELRPNTDAALALLPRSLCNSCAGCFVLPAVVFGRHVFVCGYSSFL